MLVTLDENECLLLIAALIIHEMYLDEIRFEHVIYCNIHTLANSGNADIGCSSLSSSPPMSNGKGVSPKGEILSIGSVL